MRWIETGNAHVWAAVAVRTQARFPALTNGDLHQLPGNREKFVELVAQRMSVDADEAEDHVARFEKSLDYDRFAF